jgi:hypothetical protein
MAPIASRQIAIKTPRHQRDGKYSKPMAGADVIDDRLPVGAFGTRVAHHPVPQVRVLGVEQFIKRLLRCFIRLGEAFVQPSTEQRIQFASAATSAPTQAFYAGLIHARTARKAPFLRLFR